MVLWAQSKRAEIKHSRSGRCLLSNMPEWNPSPHHRDMMIPCPKCRAPQMPTLEALMKRGQQEFL